MDPTNNAKCLSRVLKTCTHFDDSDTRSDLSMNAPARHNNLDLVSKLRSVAPSSILSLSLIYRICSNLEDNESKRKKLFSVVCEELSKQNYLDSNTDLLCQIVLSQPHIGDVVVHFIKEVHCKIAFPSQGIVAKCDIPHSLKRHLHIRQTSQYDDSFEEINVIAEGGFGIVCKARHRVDHAIYAVKKIFFKYKNDKEFEKIIREARSFASLKHPNIVSYNSAWLDSRSYSGDQNYSSTESSEGSASQKSDSFLPNSSERSVDIQFTENSQSYNTEDSNYQTIQMYESSTESSELTDAGHLVNDNSVKSSSSSSSYSTMNVLKHHIKAVSQRHSSGSTCSSVEHENLVSSTDVIAELDECKYVLSSTKSHFNTLSVKATLYIQMEYCDCDLRSWLDERNNSGTFSVSWKKLSPINILNQVLHGVEHIHSRGVIHRDLKPKNIFISKESGIVKIGDFGLACLVHQAGEESCTHCYFSKDTKSSVLGTCPYAAPEQIHGKKYDFKVDIYSSGIILFELLCFCRTSMEFYGEVNKILCGKFPESFHVEHIDLIKKMIKNEPEERPDATEILNSPVFESKSLRKKIKDLQEKMSRLTLSLQKSEQSICVLRDEAKTTLAICKEQKKIIQEKDAEIKLLKEKIEILENSYCKAQI